MGAVVGCLVSPHTPQIYHSGISYAGSINIKLAQP